MLDILTTAFLLTPAIISTATAIALMTLHKFVEHILLIFFVFFFVLVDCDDLINVFCDLCYVDTCAMGGGRREVIGVNWLY